MEESNVAERLKSFIEKMGLSYSQFADRCGIPRPSLSQLITGRNKKINDIMVGQIHNEFPQLSILWLLFGEGEMENNKVQDSDPVETEVLVGDGLGELLINSPFDLPNFNSENLNSSSSPSSDQKNFKENDLKSDSKRGKFADSKENNISKKLADLSAQLEKLRKNPRKVIQITVYYDDSTFETFQPAWFLTDF